jgi:hypothetical protein
MKKLVALALLILVFAGTANAQETIGFTNPGQTFHLENYRLPDWGYNLLYLDFDGSYLSVNQFNDTKNRGTAVRITPNYMYYRESEELIIDGSARLPVRFTGTSSETAGGVESESSEFEANLSLFGDGKYYFRDLIFATGEVGIDFDTFRRTTDGDNQMESIRRDSDSRFQVSAGAGYGRVRNVTPVIRALRFNERLNAINTGNLSDAQIQDVASIFAQRAGYSGIYDRPNKHFWNALDNAVNGGLGNMSFYNAYYLSESLMESTGIRYEGWDARGMLFIDHESFTEELEQDGNTVFDEDGSTTRYGLNLAGRFFHNLSLIQMFSVRANLGFGTATYSDVDENESLLLAGLELGHLYNITDRILIQSALSYNLEDIGSGDASLTYNVLLLGTLLTYFIENNVTVSANLFYRNEKVEFGNNDQSRSDFGLNVALRYYFLRSLMQ